jgi:hypothetical protein
MAEMASIPKPDYLREAFGSFDAEKDKDAALKFALYIMVLDDRIDRLLNLMAPKIRAASIGGDPGWEIERREITDLEGYEDWPEGATVHASVDPRGYELAHPDFYCDHLTFFEYAQRILLAYIKHLKQGT